MPKLDEIQACFDMCQSIDNLIVLEQIKMILEDTEANIKALRAMLIIEVYLRNKHKPKVFNSMLNENLTEIANLSPHKDVVLKAKKVLLIIKANIKNKEKL